MSAGAEKEAGFLVLVSGVVNQIQTALQNIITFMLKGSSITQGLLPIRGALGGVGSLAVGISGLIKTIRTYDQGLR